MTFKPDQHHNRQSTPKSPLDHIIQKFGGAVEDYQQEPNNGFDNVEGDDFIPLDQLKGNLEDSKESE